MPPVGDVASALDLNGERSDGTIADKLLILPDKTVIKDAIEEKMLQLGISLPAMVDSNHLFEVAANLPSDRLINTLSVLTQDSKKIVVCVFQLQLCYHARVPRWIGRGTHDNYNSGVTAYHVYNYNRAVRGQNVKGYRQAIHPYSNRRQ